MKNPGVEGYDVVTSILLGEFTANKQAEVPDQKDRDVPGTPHEPTRRCGPSG